MMVKLESHLSDLVFDPAFRFSKASGNLVGAEIIGRC
jgi:hypothetical protein